MRGQEIMIHGQTTRRDFMKRLLAGLSLFAGGCTRTIRQPARGSGKGSLRLGFYTDIHARTEGQTPLAMEKAAHAINARRIDLAVAGGDLITGGLTASATTAVKRWDAYMKMSQAIKADIYPTMGNHDLVTAVPSPEGKKAEEINPRAAYLTRMGLDRSFYSFDAVGYHFSILDSVQLTPIRYKYQGKVPAEQLEWLKEDLSKIPGGNPIVLATHIPLVTAFYGTTQGATYAPPNTRVVVNNRAVLKIIEKHNVIMVLQGHSHAYETVRWRNTLFISGGAICGKWWQGPWYGVEEGFCVITLAEDHVDCQYVDYGWEAV